jgi:shikimate dehydrogenase
MIKAGVIGYPINHSLSPIIHNYYLNKLEINGSYEKYEVQTENFENNINKLIKDHDLAGFNITIPHKERIISLCHEISETAKLIGAVNIVSIKNHKLYGENSDAKGFINNFLNIIPNYNFHKKNCFIIGAGGASRAIIYALIMQGVNHITIANRNLEKLQKLINDFQKLSIQFDVKIQAIEYKNNLNVDNFFNIVVNTSSLGMQGQMDLNINLKNLKQDSVIYDIVYKPINTTMINQAKSLNLTTITGIGMLIEQALVAFEMWFHKKPVYDLQLENLLINKI